jgi:hypothetical protein
MEFVSLCIDSASLNVIFRYFRQQITFVTLTRANVSMAVFTLTITNVQHLPPLTTETRAIPGTGLAQMVLHHIHEH